MSVFEINTAFVDVTRTMVQLLLDEKKLLFIALHCPIVRLSGSVISNKSKHKLF